MANATFSMIACAVPPHGSDSGPFVNLTTKMGPLLLEKVHFWTLKKTHNPNNLFHLLFLSFFVKELMQLMRIIDGFQLQYTRKNAQN